MKLSYAFLIAIALAIASCFVGRVDGASAAALQEALALVKENAPRVQKMLFDSKEACMTKMNMRTYANKLLMNLESPTTPEKCLIECLLKGAKFMDHTNRASVRTARKLVEQLAKNNSLILNVAVASTEACNRKIYGNNACDNARTISECVKNDMEVNKITVSY